MEYDIKTKKVKGRISVLQVLPYKGGSICIRKIDEDIFEYIVTFDNEIYSDYMIIDLEGKKKTNQKQTVSMGALLFTGATTTIDELVRLRTNQIVGSPVNIKKNNIKTNN